MKVYSYIRWSNPIQSMGDSFKRQMTIAENWAKSKNLQLAEQTFKDSGVSAKDGLNREKGSQFAELLKFVKNGDYILIEDYDRFSRQDPITSLTALRTILKEKQITVVFLSENVEVNQGNFLDDNIILPLFLKGFLGFRENTKKGERISKAWTTKIEAMKAGKIVRFKVPCWLKFQDGKYVIVESAAKVVRKMFAMCNQGKGSGEICIALNSDKTTPIITGQKNSKSYNQRYILNCLSNKKVIGVNDNLEPHINGFFPRIVDDKTFYTAQAKIAERNCYTGTKTADDNIFSRLCFCSACQKSYYKQTNGNSNYMRCSGTRVGECNGNTKPFYFNWFESSFLDTLFKEKSFLKKLINGEEKPNRINELKGKILITDKKIEQVTNDYTDSPSSFLAKVLAKCEVDRNNLIAELETEQIAVNSFTPYDETLDSLYEFFDLSGGKLGQPEFRKELREIVRGIVEKIVMDAANQTYSIHFKGGSKPLVVQMIKGGGWTVNGKTYTMSMDYKTGKDLIGKSHK